ncbi:MAG: energy transducer TonB [Candidatus Omnitrophota bacterium]|jgi:TonB family protein
MFTDPVFRAALTISLAAHLAVIAPWAFFQSHNNNALEKDIELNYIIIESPSLAIEEEVFSRTEEGGEQHMVETPAETIDAALAEENDKSIRETAFLKYYNLIKEKIRAKIHSIRGMGGRGGVTVAFTVDSGGRLVKINETFSDAPPEIRKKAVQGVKSASPFPPLPKELGTSPVKFSLTIKFTTN